MTGMGEVAAIGDAEALAEAILKVLRAPTRYARPRREIEDRFSLDRTVSSYEHLFESAVEE
jgi:hypothetical protein